MEEGSGNSHWLKIMVKNMVNFWRYQKILPTIIFVHAVRGNGTHQPKASQSFQKPVELDTGMVSTQPMCEMCMRCAICCDVCRINGMVHTSSGVLLSHLADTVYYSVCPSSLCFRLSSKLWPPFVHFRSQAFLSKTLGRRRYCLSIKLTENIEIEISILLTYCLCPAHFLQKNSH